MDEDLAAIDLKIQTFKDQNEYLKALKCMERGLILREKLHGFDRYLGL